MATVEELEEYLVKQERKLVVVQARAIRDLSAAGSIEERKRQGHLADRYGHFLEVLTCVRRFLEGREEDLCPD